MGARKRLGYRPALDGVRGIAIAIVVAYHAFGWPGEGTLGVDLFFVLSGFLITTLLLEEHERMGAISIRAFYRRRARRLLPALFVMLAPFLVLAAVSAAVTASFRSPLFLRLVAALTYASNIVVAPDISAMPAALLALALVYRLQLVLRGASIGRLYYAPDTHADPLLIGCALGCCFARGRLPSWIVSSTRARELAGATALVLVLAAAVFLDRLPERLAYETQLLPTMFALAAGALVVCAAMGGSALARGLTLRPLVFLGRISYS